MTATLFLNARLLPALLLAFLAPVAAADVPVLAYHHVASETPPSTSTTPELFRDQLDLIEQLRMDVVRLDGETVESIISGDGDGGLRTALTFDDAYESVYTTAWPILRKRGMPFTIFVNTDAINDGMPGYMSWSQLRELANHDLVTIGNHTSNHASLLRRPDESANNHAERVAKAMDKAATRINEKLGVATSLFAHPYGEFSKTASQALEKRGWYGFAQHSGVMGPHSSPYAIPRFPVANAYGGIDTLRSKLRARNFPALRKELPSPVIGEENPPELHLPLPEDWNPERLACYARGEGKMDIETLEQDQQVVAVVQAKNALNARRSRYNCTYPASEGRFYWLSQPWFNRDMPVE